MSKQPKKKTIEFTCPCKLQLTLYKTFEIIEGTPPEEVITECPQCEQKIKLQSENQLARDQIVYRSFKA